MTPEKLGMTVLDQDLIFSASGTHGTHSIPVAAAFHLCVLYSTGLIPAATVTPFEVVGVVLACLLHAHCMTPFGRRVGRPLIRGLQWEELGSPTGKPCIL